MEKNEIKQNHKKAHFFEYILIGAQKTANSPLWVLIVLMVLTIEVRYVAAKFLLLEKLENFALLSGTVQAVALAVIALLIDTMILFFIGKPRKADETEANLICAGFTNSAGEAPYLIKYEHDNKNKKVEKFTFAANSIPLSKWQSERDSLESALNITITDIKRTKGKKQIIITFVDGENDFPTNIKWDNGYISKKDFELVVGLGADGMPVKIDLNVIPMVLIGGATGSGKSVLLKLLLMQALNKGAEVIISDFKGGVDFPPVWHKKCRLLFDEVTLLEALNELIKAIEERKQILKESGFANIHEYNKAHTGDMKRIIFACDEIAEVLDTKGLSKEQKDLVNQIEAALSTIARQGRAFGVHLFLATQRPDAAIIPGQIKNNCQCKMCGSCDQILSQIVLDCSDASDVIPKNIPGRFMLNDPNKTVFQSFLFSEERDML